MRLTLARYMPAGGVTLNKRLKYRNYNLRFSNKWHDTNELKVVDEGYKAACESKGIRVYDAQVCRYIPIFKNKLTITSRLNNSIVSIYRR